MKNVLFTQVDQSIGLNNSFNSRHDTILTSVDRDEVAIKHVNGAIGVVCLVRGERVAWAALHGIVKALQTCVCELGLFEPDTRQRADATFYVKASSSQDHLEPSALKREAVPNVTAMIARSRACEARA